MLCVKNIGNIGNEYMEGETFDTGERYMYIKKQNRQTQKEMTFDPVLIKVLIALYI